MMVLLTNVHAAVVIITNGLTVYVQVVLQHMTVHLTAMENVRYAVQFVHNAVAMANREDVVSAVKLKSLLFVRLTILHSAKVHSVLNVMSMVTAIAIGNTLTHTLMNALIAIIPIVTIGVKDTAWIAMANALTVMVQVQSEDVKYVNMNNS